MTDADRIEFVRRITGAVLPPGAGPLAPEQREAALVALCDVTATVFLAERGVPISMEGLVGLTGAIHEAMDRWLEGYGTEDR